MTSESARHRADRNRIVGACVTYAALLFASLATIGLIGVTQPWQRAALGALPLFGLALLVRAMVLAHRGSDEMQRRIDGEAAVVAALIVGLVTFGYALMAQAMGEFAQPNVLLLLVGPGLMGVWGAARYVIWWRYQ